MTMTEKVLARVSGRASVTPGEYLSVTPDLLIIHEFFIYPQTVTAMAELGLTKIHDPERVMVVFDHATPATSAKWAEKLRRGREFVRTQGITKFYDVGYGISHQIAAELGYIIPGMFVTNGDPHVTAYGAFGCFAPAIGTQTQLELLLTGTTWIQVPHTLRINIDGRLPSGVTARDVFMAAMQTIGLDGALGTAMEFTGPTVSAMSMDQRMTLTSLAPLAGAINAIIAPDETTRGYLAGRVPGSLPQLANDLDALYARTINLDASTLQPLVNRPPDPVTAYPISEQVPIPVHQGFIGSCAGGRLDELRVAASILTGRRIHADTRLIVTPASKEVYAVMLREGLARIFLEAGATIESPGCGACMGFKGALADYEVCVANSTQNMRGRMGSLKADIYLANAAVVAASCIVGHLTDPRPLLEGREVAA